MENNHKITNQEKYIVLTVFTVFVTAIVFFAIKTAGLKLSTSAIFLTSLYIGTMSGIVILLMIIAITKIGSFLESRKKLSVKESFIKFISF